MKKTSGIQPMQEKHFGANPLVSLALTSFALQINVHFFIYIKRKRRRRKSQRMELWKLLWINAMNLLNSNKTVIFPTSWNPFDPSLFFSLSLFFYIFPIFPLSMALLFNPASKSDLCFDSCEAIHKFNFFFFETSWYQSDSKS